MSRRQKLVERLLDEARLAIDQSDHEVATERLLDVLDLDPDNADARRLVDDPRSRDRARRGEKKLVTVVFTDQVGSTPFVHRQGGEATTWVYRLYHELFGKAVETNGGLIQSFQGDGLVACFGHPIAHENDSERAIDAALATMAGLGPLQQMVRDELGDEFAIRIGVHTGEVVVAELGTATSPLRHALTGVTPNVASRIQDVADAGQVAISDATARLLEDSRYELVSLGHHMLKGLDAETLIWRVVGERSPASSRRRFLLSPLVGRADEVAAIAAHWAEVHAGLGGRSVLISGDPGLGKSRLLSHTRDVCLAAGATVISARGTELDRSKPLHYLAKALAPHIDVGSFEPAHDRELIAGLFDPRTSALSSELEPTEMRRRALVALENWIAGQATDTPVVLLLDDLQWADPSTRLWFEGFSERLPPGVLAVVASRNIEDSLRVDSALELFPLADEEANRMVANLIADSPDLVEAVVRRADGVPLFLEELAQWQTDGEIPSTLREVVQAELEPESLRFFAQVLATIGETVPTELLVDVAASMDYTIDEVGRQLEALVDKGIIVQVSASEYKFRHYLVWRAAYESQLVEVRVERHGAVAEGAGAGAPPDQNPLADLAGRQFLLAGRPVEGCTQLLGAVAQSQLVGAHQEGLEQLGEVERALVDVPPEVAPVFDVGLRIRRALSTTVTRGFADPVVKDDFATASATARALVHVPELQSSLVPALMGLWSYYVVAGDYNRSQPLMADLSGLQLGPDWTRTVTTMSAIDAFYRGELAEARRLLDSVVDEFDTATAPTGWALPNDPYVAGFAVASAAAVLDGDDTAAEDLLDRGLVRSAAIDFPIGPISEAFMRCYYAMAQGLVGRHDHQLEHGALAMELGLRHGFVEWSTIGEIHVLASRALAGETGLASGLSEAIARWRASGAGAFVPSLLLFEAELAIEAGDQSRAIALLDESDAIASATAQRVGLHRLVDLRERNAHMAKEMSR